MNVCQYGTDMLFIEVCLHTWMHKEACMENVITFYVSDFL